MLTSRAHIKRGELMPREGIAAIPERFESFADLLEEIALLGEFHFRPS